MFKTFLTEMTVYMHPCVQKSLNKEVHDSKLRGEVKQSLPGKSVSQV